LVVDFFFSSSLWILVQKTFIYMNSLISFGIICLGKFIYRIFLIQVSFCTGKTDQLKA